MGRMAGILFADTAHRAMIHKDASAQGDCTGSLHITHIHKHTLSVFFSPTNITTLSHTHTNTGALTL